MVSRLLNISVLLILGFGFFALESTAQITSIDDLLEQVREEAASDAVKREHACSNRGFKILNFETPEIESELGTSLMKVTEVLNEKGYETRYRANFSSAPFIQTPGMTCRQKSSATYPLFCRRDTPDARASIMSATARFGLAERNGRCEDGMSDPLKFTYHESRAITFGRPIVEDPYHYFGIRNNEAWELAVQKLSNLGWATEESNLMKRSWACENGRNSRVEFIKKEQESVLMQFRIHLQLTCVNNEETSAKISAIEPFL